MNKTVLRAISESTNPFDDMMDNWYTLSDYEKAGVVQFLKEAVASEVGEKVYGVIKAKAVATMMEERYEDAIYSRGVDEELDKALLSEVEEIKEKYKGKSMDMDRKGSKAIARLYAKTLLKIEGEK